MISGVTASMVLTTVLPAYIAVDAVTSKTATVVEQPVHNKNTIAINAFIILN